MFSPEGIWICTRIFLKFPATLIFMALQDLILEDVVLERPDSTQLKNIQFIYNYVKAHNMKVHNSDKFPRQIDSDSTSYFYENGIYKYDIKTPFSNSPSDYGCAQFIVDSEKIILRPFYPTEEYSVQQRDIILRDVIRYLIKSEFINQKL
jgi:hypothetical protein